MSLWSRIERRISNIAGDLLLDEFRQDLFAVREMLEAGEPEEAIAKLDRLLATRPDHPDALYLYGLAELDRGRFAHARGLFERVLTGREALPEAHLGLGHACLSLGQNRPAIESFRRAIALAGGDRAVLAAAYRGLGMAYRRTGDLDKAIRELRKAVAEDDRDPVARAWLGEALLVDERISAEEARRHLARALELSGEPKGGEPKEGEPKEGKRDKAPPLAFLALGQIALQEGEVAGARAFFQRALDGAADRAGVVFAEHRVEGLIGLGDAALAEGDASGAKAFYEEALERVTAPARTAFVHARLGDVYGRLGSGELALASYERSLALVNSTATLRRALDTALETGAIMPAVRLANDLLAVDPKDARAMVARGVALARQGQHEAARATFALVLNQGDDAEAHLALGRLELDADPSRAAGARAAKEALAALQIDPRSERARELLAEARARELASELASPAEEASGETTGGDAVADAAAGGAEAAARVEAGVAGAEAGVAEAARAADVRVLDGGMPGHDTDELYLLAERFGRLARARSELAELAGEAAQATADFDQPLLVTIMGEFSSGKSSFVNAFIGEEVAPTGITPTTATINIVKYGRERGGRILYRDGNVETLSWDVLFPTLRALRPERVRLIEVVEILLPLPQLERVNIVDTPGLNSILPEHEEVARGFIARADAVLWLFTANQAGKASERRALQRIRGEGKQILGVLNKKDQLSPADIAELVTYVSGELGEMLELIVPFSARQALASRRAGVIGGKEPQPAGESEGDDGNWRALSVALEERFFARARQLKRDACSRRLAGLIERASRTVDEERQRALAVERDLAAAAEGLRDAGVDFIDRVVVSQRHALAQAAEELYRHAAREVLDLVRPRQLPFGSHQATPADRDYLLALLDSGYEAAIERSRREVAAVLRGHGAQASAAILQAASVLGMQPVSDMARTAVDAERLVEAQVFDRTRAYLRGYLNGGFVTSFFRLDLPKLDLSEEAVYLALVRDAPNLDAEITLRLANAGAAALTGLAQRLEHWAGVAGVLAYDLQVGVCRVLEHIEQRRRHLSA